MNNNLPFHNVSSFSSSPNSVPSPVSFNQEMIVNMAQNVNNMLNNVTMGAMGGSIVPRPSDSNYSNHIPPPPPPPGPPQMNGMDTLNTEEVEGDEEDYVVFSGNTAGMKIGSVASVRTVTVSGISMDDVIEFMNTPREPSHDDDVDLIEGDEGVDEGDSSESRLLDHDVVSPRGNDFHSPSGHDDDVDLIDPDQIIIGSAAVSEVDGMLGLGNDGGVTIN